MNAIRNRKTKRTVNNYITIQKRQRLYANNNSLSEQMIAALLLAEPCQPDKFNLLNLLNRQIKQ